MLRATTLGIVASFSVIAGDKIDDMTTVKLGAALSVGVVVVTATWKLSSWMRGIDDSLKELHGKFNNLPCDECTVGKKPPTKR